MRLTALACLLAVAACVDSGPLVTDYNGNIVKLQFHSVPLGDNYRGSPLYTKAVEVCGRDATYQGMRYLGAGQGEHVFLCFG